MKIVTWNVNGIRACFKKGLIDILDDLAPDILCLQETKAHIDQVETSVKTLGYKNSWWSSAVKKGYSGVATFTDQQPISVTKGWGQEEYDSEGRLVITDHGAFILYNIYFPNGGSGDARHQFKQKFLRDLNAHLKSVIETGREIVLVGDYNVAHTEIDVHDPVRLSKVSGFLPEERRWLDSFLELGFVDCFRKFYPDQPHRYTWWDQRQMARIANRGWRIDYVCVTKGLESKVKSCEILDQILGSDHCPVAVTLDV